MSIVSIVVAVSLRRFLKFPLLFSFQVIHVHLEEEHVVKKRSLNQNLRIKLYYDESVYK